MNAERKKARPKIPPITAEEALELVKMADKAMVDFEGPFEELESALGMLLMGRLFGWRVLLLIHNKRTIRKYQEILGGVDIREMFPETGPFARKSNAFRWVEKFGEFWKAVSGERSIENRRTLENE